MIATRFPRLDTEGFDFEILKMLWETPFRPTLITFESEHLSRHDKLACAQELRREGYQYVTINRDTIALNQAATPATRSDGKN